MKVKELKAMIREAIVRGIDNLSSDDVLGAKEPEGDTDPRMRLITKLMAAAELRKKFQGKSPEEVSQALGLGSDPEIIDLIGQFMTSPFYQDNPNHSPQSVKW